MPTYDYRCRTCSTTFQAFHAIDHGAPACPACGGAPDRIILTAPAVHGRMAQGREAAVQTLERQASASAHGPGCPCCSHRPD